MNCQDCNNVNPQIQPQVVIQQVMPQVEMSMKSRTVYALLAFFFGGIGVHEFYRGKIGNGIACIFGSIIITPFVVQISNGIALFITKTDADNKMLQGSAVAPILCGIFMIIGNLLALLLVILTMFVLV